MEYISQKAGSIHSPSGTFSISGNKILFFGVYKPPEKRYVIFKQSSERVQTMQEKGTSNISSRQPVYQNPVTGSTPFRASLKNHGAFCDHWHGEMEIFYTMPGSGPVNIYVEGHLYHLTQRSMLVIPSTCVHRIEPCGCDNLLLRLDVGYPLLGENFRPFSEKHLDNPYYSFCDGGSPHMAPLEEIFMAISREKAALSNHSPENNHRETLISRMRISSYLFQLCAMMLEVLSFSEPQSSDPKRRYTHQIIQSLIFYIRDHYQDPLTLEKAASITGYEKTRFCQLFRESTGLTFHKFLTKCRLEAALPLLQNTSLPIASIGKYVGIPQSKTFSRLIHQQYGASPIQIRQASIERRNNP